MRRVLYFAVGLALSGIVVGPQAAHAQLDAFVGQLMVTGANFCPRGWAPASGQLLSISQNTALFSLLGTTYGGDGRVTFGLPDLRGRAPIHNGQGPGLSNYDLGQTGGEETHSLTVNEMPAHRHQAFGSTALPSALGPGGAESATQDRVKMYAPPGSEVAMAASAIGITGGNQPFDIRSPFLTLQWCIALEGIFPSRE
jgi:microcystin-dependent protein